MAPCCGLTSAVFDNDLCTFWSVLAMLHVPWMVQFNGPFYNSGSVSFASLKVVSLPRIFLITSLGLGPLLVRPVCSMIIGKLGSHQQQQKKILD
jgi:hypothetical protein